MGNYTSTYNINDLIAVPEALQLDIYAKLENQLIEPALFRKENASGPVIGYRELQSLGLKDKPETVAEFAEIPVSYAPKGELKHVDIYKTAQGVSISREMIRDNSIAAVDKQVNDLVFNMERYSLERTIDAFNNDSVNTIAASAPWTEDKSSPLEDIFEAQDKVDTATDNNGLAYSFASDTLLINHADYNRALRSDDIQKFYNGNIASENPIYKGEQPAELNGLKIITSRFVPTGTAYVLQSQVAGFYADLDPLTVTPLYSTNGDNGYGGSNQAYRVDAFISRGIALEAPKAVTKITGIRS